LIGAPITAKSVDLFDWDNLLIMTDKEVLNEARERLWLDFFGGWSDADIRLLSRYEGQRRGDPQPGEIFDWLGVRTLVSHHGWLERPDSGIIDISTIPVPSDMIHAEAIEYVSLLVAIERALAAGRRSFVAVELGASYGPWITAAGVVARRLGFDNVNLVAVEASEQMIPEIMQHAAINGLVADTAVQVRAMHAAVYTTEQDLFFPKINVRFDNGAQVSAEDLTKDYRGLDVEYDKIQGVSLRTICQDLEMVDFMHLDLQGVEEELLQDEDFLDTLTEKTATFFLATQSRLIEGIALKALSARGWILVRERPTTYKFVADRSDVNGWTLRDGGQIWLNSRYGNSYVDF
jgi:FkbM family methyltransferase